MTRTPSYLPPERMLPPKLRERILRDTMAPEPGRGRLSAPLAAAAAVLLVVALALLLTHLDRPSRIVPADRLPIPGYTRQQIDDLTRQCRATVPAHDKAEFPDMRLYNVRKDASGLLALFYAPIGWAECGYTGYGRHTLGPAAIGGGSTTWLQAPVQYDGGTEVDGGNVNRAFAGNPGYVKLYGRAAPYVVRVELDVAGKSTTVPVINGTFIVTVFTSENYRATGQYELFGYRKDGSIVRNPAPNSADGKPICVLAPDGTVVAGEPGSHPEHCRSAIRWR
jgi:hypothetical protein